MLGVRCERLENVREGDLDEGAVGAVTRLLDPLCLGKAHRRTEDAKTHAEVTVLCLNLAAEQLNGASVNLGSIGAATHGSDACRNNGHHVRSIIRAEGEDLRHGTISEDEVGANSQVKSV
jgi:hypothetical protein